MAAWWGPKKPAAVAPKPVVKAATKGAPRMSKPVTVATKKIAYYDPSRVIDPSQIKVVKDLRERGDNQAGDRGHLGPGSRGGPFVGRPVTPPPQPQKKELTPGQLAALGVLGFLLFGG